MKMFLHVFTHVEIKKWRKDCNVVIHLAHISIVNSNLFWLLNHASSPYIALKAVVGLETYTTGSQI